MSGVDLVGFLLIFGVPLLIGGLMLDLEERRELKRLDAYAERIREEGAARRAEFQAWYDSKRNEFVKGRW